MSTNSYIEQTLQLYNDSFFKDSNSLVVIDWINSSWESIDANNQNAVLTFYTEAKNKIECYSRDAFILISKSILCGEYIFLDNFENLILEFQVKEVSKSATLLNNDINSNEGRFGFIKSDTYKLFYKTTVDLEKTLKRYKNLRNIAEEKINLSRDVKNSLFNFVDAKVSEITNEYFKKLNEYVILLAEFDYLLSLENIDLQREVIIMMEFLESEKKVQNKDLRLIYSILYDKCCFFILVVLQGEHLYSINFEIKKIDINKLEAGILQNVVKHSNILSSKEESDYSLEFVSNYISRTSNRTLLDYVHTMKYYKKICEDIGSVDELILDFDNFYNNYETQNQNFLSIYNLYSLNTVKNYLHNSQFSLHLKQNNFSYLRLRDCINKIISLQNQTAIKNYYPFKKSCEFLMKDLVKEFGREEIIENVISDKIEYFKKLISYYRENLGWCRTRNFYRFQLFFEENNHNCSGSGFKIFIPIISKPINFKHEEEIIDSYRLEIVNFENLKSTLEKQNKLLTEINEEKANVLSLKSDIVKAKNEIQETKSIIEKESKETQKRNIELLSIFAGAITFLFGITVEIFSSRTDLAYIETIKHLGILGVIILLFVSSIMFISPFYVKESLDWKLYWKTPRVFIFGFIILGLLLILGFTLYPYITK
ncbi:hypothetical protein [Dysgonomonas sp. GY617]|uniref:hypothetical protein n=1 Tax=Dysgonomonas sp. GY617 TaxID=2780420 RepID=UPI00188457E9|nr:hypothetical protein [Dysgonomonas sp. GY617]MBF0576384.1 hypothetical protein [Dysgonomonas sp. GY617]